ncbi:hypothetical protein Gotur_000420 [Gossypium turneri]
MLQYDDTNSSSSSNSENAELFKNQSDGEKTSTDQDEDIKVSTCNSDGENTSSEDENIEIPDPMDTETTDPDGKRKIELDSQTDDYLIKDLDKDQNIGCTILTSKIENLTINNINPENTGKSFSKTLFGRKTIRPNTHHRHKKKKYYKLVKWKIENKK